jgi:hypothetical protein
VRHLVVGTPQLEAEDGLEILTLQQDVAFQPLAQVRGTSQRCFLDDLVDLGGQDEAQVLLGQPAISPLTGTRTSGEPFGSRKSSGTP